MTAILILGGYGGFGAALSRRLAGRGHRILVAGRRLEAARAFCAHVPGTEAIEADRTGDIAGLLRHHEPALVIDAAGPFQASTYLVPQCCIAAGIHYLDLADSRTFVSGIEALDEDARDAGVTVISGASSVPALSGAAVHKLVLGMDMVASIEAAVSASNKATLGPSVAAAILSYVGKPVPVWRAQRWHDAWGWQSLKREHFEWEGEKGLSRLVALADVPDLAIFPKSIAGAPATNFRAGPEFAFQTIALWLMSWWVRWRWLGSLEPLAPMLTRLRTLTRGIGGDRSAMAVDVRGMIGNDTVARRWTLFADRGDGPEIPTLAAVLLAEKILAGSTQPGARHAAEALALEEFEPLFATLAIRHAVTETRRPALYARVMGGAFDRLPAAVRAMHLVSGDAGASGHARVVRGTHPVARLIGWLMHFPPTGDHVLHVAFSERDGVERWTRDFSGSRFTSSLREENGRLVERFGPLRFHFDLPSDAQGLTMAFKGWSLLRMPLPLVLGPRGLVREWEKDGDFCFDVPIALPLIGPVVHYTGRLRKGLG